ncbi:hypothetical protein [Thermovibrio ammonificans]|uniref:Lipoprotein n=1 Tax=Thermovibrio ammonificans (strain DSM 15698 / JCM 12110 / HB-1) TaxID=648996 RepID=E8T2Z6_THEA1|nr:hypothetical protein [Thermovibrio ammonificans]ADU97205.1 hypothetical protein Theam_1241 [Thermovibrio ammonificans HB-1]
MKKLLLCVAALFVASCGGPEFAVSYRYEPPADNRACLSGCYESFKSCKESCEDSYNACMAQVRSRAERLYRQALAVYNRELSAYRAAYATYQNRLLSWSNSYRQLYRDYLFFKRACKKSKDYYACSRKYQLEQALDTLNEKKPLPPERPEPPKLSDFVRQLSVTCVRDCGCKQQFNACFTGCGGKLIPERICVSNCK